MATSAPAAVAGRPHLAPTANPLGRRTRTLCWLLAAASVVSALPTLLVDGLLNGPAVMNGSARGTALVVLFGAVPVLVGALTRSVPTARNTAVAAGALGYLAYNAGLLVHATPFNEMFLAYVAMQGLAWAALVSLLLDVRSPGPVSDRLPARRIAAFLGGVVVLNTAGWLAFVLPELDNAGDPAFLEGTGLTTNPIYAQDLAFFLPAVALTAVLLWRRRPWGGFLAGAVLVFWTLESIGVAVDQWMGQRADPGSSVATYGGAVMFVVLGLLTVVPLVAWLRHPVATADEDS
jgi:hypothetical protein